MIKTSSRFEDLFNELLARFWSVTYLDSRILRVIYAFDPRRKAILLIGGDKRGEKNWYDTIIPIAEEIYLNHLKEISRELEGGELDGSKI